MFVIHVGIVAGKVEAQFYFYFIFYGNRDCLVFDSASAIVLLFCP